MGQASNGKRKEPNSCARRASKMMARVASRAKGQCDEGGIPPSNLDRGVGSREHKSYTPSRTPQSSNRTRDGGDIAISPPSRVRFEDCGVLDGVYDLCSLDPTPLSKLLGGIPPSSHCPFAREATLAIILDALRAHELGSLRLPLEACPKSQ